MFVVNNEHFDKKNVLVRLKNDGFADFFSLFKTD